MQSIPTQVGSPYEGEGDEEESEAETTDTGLQQLHTEQNVSTNLIFVFEHFGNIYLSEINVSIAIIKSK